MALPPLVTPVIFAGQGNNLYPLCDPSVPSSSSSPTSPLPKALLPLANRPLVSHTLQWLADAGVRHALLFAAKKEHAAIAKSLSRTRLVLPTAVEGRRNKEPVPASSDGDRANVHVTTYESLKKASTDSAASSAPSSAVFNLQLLPLGPWDAKGAIDPASSDEATFRKTLIPGTAELLGWAQSIGLVRSDPLVLPADLFFPTYPLIDLLATHLAASAPSSPSLTALFYERGAGEGTGKEREREATPRSLVAYSNTSPAPSLHFSTVGPSVPAPLSTSHSLLSISDSSRLGASDELALRRTLLTSHPHARLSTTLLDAHVYIIKRSVLSSLLEARPDFTGLREHVVPLLTRCSWQAGLREKVGWPSEDDDDALLRGMQTPGGSNLMEESVGDLRALALKGSFGKRDAVSKAEERQEKLRDEARKRATTLQGPSPRGELRCIAVIARLTPEGSDEADETQAGSGAGAAAQNAAPSASSEAGFLARCNTLPSYLESTRWLLKKLSTPHSLGVPLPTQLSDASSSSTSSPIVSAPSAAAPVSGNVSTTSSEDIASSAQLSADTLVGPNARIGERAVLKRCVVGKGAVIARGARLTGCVVLDEARVGENAKLENCILGPRSVIGERSSLKDCDVGAGLRVKPESNVKHEKIDEESEDEEESGEEDEEEGESEGED